MEIRVFDTAEQVGQAAAMLLGAQLLQKPDSVLGLATGSSPLPIYEALIELHQRGVLDFSRATTFNLDEYVGLPAGHPKSYRRFMEEHLFSQVNLRPEATHIPNGCAADLSAEAAAYDAAIQQAGGLDIQLLGIGRNGHIGFNEPGDCFVSGCHVVELSESTVTANARFFTSPSEVPRRAVSLGIGGIMSARKILLIATGQSKADAIAQTVLGDITPRVPASILQAHPNAMILLDRAAASGLSQKDAF
ncbi:MAG: glucosamine-6-phosphate deaminase [Christensenellaceae bacterium]|nr:glucosamine-6-phosphate deaminase [Christensenellaceae bacterium]